MISKATVVFGGPAAEHDISILTGLQGERVLSGAGVAVQPVYWSRNDQWFLVPAGLEARDFTEGDGVPSGSKKLELRIGAKKGSGFYLEGGLGGGKLLETGPVLSCFHGGAGESGGAQALFELLGIKATGGTVAAAALGMDKLAFGGVMEAAGVPSLTRTLLSSASGRRSTAPTSSSRGSAAPPSASRWSRTGRPRSRCSPRRRTCARARSSSRTGRTSSTSTLGPHGADAGRLPDREAAAARRRRDLLLRREVPPPRGPLRRTPRVPRRHLARAAGHHPVPGRPRRRAHRADRHRADRLPVRRHRGVRQRGQLDPGRAVALPLARHLPADVLVAALEEAERARPRATGNYEVGVALRAAGGIAGKLAGLPQQPR